MSKKGKARRTRAQRVADRDKRSTVAYLRRLQREIEKESLGWIPPTDPSSK